MEIGNKVKVIQLDEYDKADTTLEIGDIGTIIDFSEDGDVIEVAFDDNKVEEMNKNSYNYNKSGTYDMFVWQVEVI